MKKISKKEEVKLNRKARKASVKEGSFFSIMDGFGLRYITPFALALGATTRHIGILSSLPGLLGSLSMLKTNSLMMRYSRKKILTVAVFIQSLLWLPLILISAMYFIFGLNSQIAIWSLIIIYTLIIVAGSIGGPAWSSWMKDIVPKHIGAYFGFRNRIVGFVALMSMLAAGLILDQVGKTSIFFAFALLFGLAFFGRALSAYYFKKQYEPVYKYDKKSFFSFKDFVSKMFFNNYGKFVLFISLISFGVAVASPYFAVFMLRNLGFSYLSYTFVIFSGALSLLGFLPIWGKFSDRYGNVKTLKISGILIALVPFIFVYSYHIFKIRPELVVGYLIAAEIFNGFAWAGFNIGSGNFIYDAVSNEKVALCASYFNILNAFGAFAGAMLGGLLGVLPWSVFGFPALIMVFLLSGILRMLFALWFGLSVKEVRKVRIFDLENSAKKDLAKIDFSNMWKYFTYRIVRPL
jgi:MFS family permease